MSSKKASRGSRGGTPGSGSRSGRGQKASASSRRRQVDLSVLGPHPLPDYFPVIRYFREHTGDVPAAMDRFYSAVGTSPEVEADQSLSDQLLGNFVEWFVFEYRLADGRTPLQHYALCAPARTPEQRATAELLRQSVASQLFSLFWVRSADAACGTLTLQDATVGTTYEVYDRMLASDLAGHVPAQPAAVDAGEGATSAGDADADAGEAADAPNDHDRTASLVATRLVCLDGEWRCPMGAVLIRHGMDETRFSQMLATLAETGSGVGFLDAVMVELGDPDALTPGVSAARGTGGPEGERRCEESTGEDESKNAADGTPEGAHQTPPLVVLDGPSSEVPGMDTPPEQRAAQLLDAAKLYGLLRRDFDLEPTWGELTEAVRACPIEREAKDVVAGLFGANDHGLDHLDDDAFNDLMYAFLVAWGLVGRDALDGRSLAEVYQGR